MWLKLISITGENPGVDVAYDIPPDMKLTLEEQEEERTRRQGEEHKHQVHQEGKYARLVDAPAEASKAPKAPKRRSSEREPPSRHSVKRRDLKPAAAPPKPEPLRLDSTSLASSHGRLFQSIPRVTWPAW